MAEESRGQGPTEPQESDDMDERVKFILEASRAKTESLERALERNWIVHLVLAGLGLAFVYEIRELLGVLANYFRQNQFNPKPVAVIVLPMLLYYFMRFGHLLSSFLAVRRLHDQLFEASIGTTLLRQDLTPLRDTTSFFELFYSSASTRAPIPLLVAYFVVTPVVISLTQASALFLIVRAYGLNLLSISIVVAAALMLAVLYWGFWRTNREHPGTTTLAIVCVALVIGWLFLFAKTA